jgi:dTDP-4-dehydrorhamnose reductase
MTAILITGTTGLVGSCLYQYLKRNTAWDITGVSRSPGEYVDIRTNLEERDSVQKIGNGNTFDVIVHTAALTKTDICENRKAECTAANVDTTRNLVNVFPSARMIFFSTYAVYNTPEGNCDELCPVYPTNHYVATKIQAEEIVNTLDESVILRPSVIFGYIPVIRQSKNYFMQLLENIRKHTVMRSPRDQYFNPVHIDTVIAIIHCLLEKKRRGIFNIGCNETISKFEFNRRIMKRFQFDESFLEGIDSRQLQVTRPNNGTISSRKIQAELAFTIPPLEKMIDALYESVPKRVLTEMMHVPSGKKYPDIHV